MRKKHRRAPSPFILFSLLGGAVAVAVVFGIASALEVSSTYAWILAWLGGVNVAVVFLYGYDKTAARAEALRVPESVLHLYALAGGTPAAFVAQRIFSHKTIKSRFQRTFWLILVLQVIAIAAIVWIMRR